MVGQLSELIGLKESLAPIKNLRAQVAFKCHQYLQKGIQSRMLDNMLWLEVSLVPFPPFHVHHHKFWLKRAELLDPRLAKLEVSSQLPLK